MSDPISDWVQARLAASTERAFRSTKTETMTYPASVMGSVVSYLEGKGMNAMADAVQELKAENERLRAALGNEQNAQLDAAVDDMIARYPKTLDRLE